VRYEVAVLLADAKRARDRFGPNAVGRLAASLHRAPGTLYREAAVAECWPPPVFGEHRGRRDARGRPLSWSHWVSLATVSDAGRRDALLARAWRDALSARALRALVGGAVISPKRDADLTMLLRAYARRSAGCARQATHVEQAILARRARDAIDPIVIDDAIDAQRQLVAAATSLLHRLEAARAPRLRALP
jgi:hypothetical protein